VQLARMLVDGQGAIFAAIAIDRNYPHTFAGMFSV
jgi:hypothetical protein